MRLVVHQLELLLIELLPHWIWALNYPILECLTNGLQLRFQPQKPFFGHIYVKGLFKDENCHLDFTRRPTANPILFQIRYGSPCNVICETQVEPPGLRYHVVIIVQHHHLFLTQADNVYSANCFYGTGSNNLVQNMEVGLPVASKITSGMVATCSYNLLNYSLSSQTIKFANIGDRVIHNWRCSPDLKEYGMLVHSCFVHESNFSFQIIDKQGCIIDRELMEPVIYSNDLLSAHSVVPAFKFSDLMTVRFQCRVTLCSKIQNGCDGISPPNCTQVSIPFIASSKKAEAELCLSNVTSKKTLPITKMTSEEYVNGGHLINANNLDEDEDEESDRQLNYKQKRSVDKFGSGMNRSFRIMSNFSDEDRLTVDINSDELIVLERYVVNRTQILTALHPSCEVSRNMIVMQTAIFILLSVPLITIIFIQKRYYDRRLLK
uniref:ZP domain-containing protein n=1 Tax=Setaria digitata TaxID=48799 RepID=A0A915PFB3_9BILA